MALSKEAMKGLEPQSLWGFFYDITQIPRPSKFEDKYVKKYNETFSFQ